MDVLRTWFNHSAHRECKKTLHEPVPDLPTDRTAISLSASELPCTTILAPQATHREKRWLGMMAGWSLVAHTALFAALACVPVAGHLAAAPQVVEVDLADVSLPPPESHPAPQAVVHAPQMSVHHQAAAAGHRTVPSAAAVHRPVARESAPAPSAGAGQPVSSEPVGTVAGGGPSVAGGPVEGGGGGDAAGPGASGHGADLSLAASTLKREAARVDAQADVDGYIQGWSRQLHRAAIEVCERGGFGTADGFDDGSTAHEGLVVDVAVARDGNLAGVHVLHSSGDKLADMGAVHLVQYAAPFAPLPDSLHSDTLHIVKPWVSSECPVTAR